MLKFHVSMGMLFLFTISFLSYSQDAVAGHEIIGAPKCKACHKAKTGDQWKIWTESAHARSFKTLASEQARKIAADNGLGDPQKEESCLKCHATLAYLGSGAVVSEKGKYTDGEGIGCESCHGPGSDYKSKKTMEDPEAARQAGMLSAKTVEACTTCHNEQSPTFREFDFEKRWAEIAHPLPNAAIVSSESPAVPSNMPGEITYTSSVGNVLFPHNLHVKDLEIECAECHHQILAMELVTPHPDYLTSSWTSCNTCHGANSETSDKYYKCSDCHHLNPENIADETLSSKVVTHASCWNCHDSGTGVQASEGCSECHVKEEK